MAATMVKKMPYVRLGNSGLKVSKIILGTMQYGSSGWQEWVVGEEEAIKHIKFAYENGIQTFDTANVYSNGLSEIILGNAIKKLELPREEIVVMTKLYNPVPSDYGMNLVATGKRPEEVGIINQHGLNRKVGHDTSVVEMRALMCTCIRHIAYLRLGEGQFEAPAAGLHRSSPMCVPLAAAVSLLAHASAAGHRFDYSTPIEETMQALHDVVKAGYVRYIGMSSCYAYQSHTLVHAMQNYAINNKLTPFISMQNHYSLIYREEEREMFPTLKLFGVGSMPWSPLGRGVLTRPISAQSKRGDTDWFINRYKGSSTTDIVNRVEEIAHKKGISMAQVAIAWVLSRDGVSAPIVGTTSLDNLKDILGGVNVKLTEQEIAYLEEPYQPLNIIGHA
ncbi:Versiconal hemiacetal acetate reductase [Grifola frondosa]|uniref:Versiconal hemiacetal acetate reductase n=1 Tax=Grifola frondosa TaxID=5627 RepID=A0A1C7MGM7_GRIFR|nr:Versiconal hemiacetal acetate reductase [Grifola frondosa]